MLRKFLEYEFSLEAVLTLIIMACLFTLLFKTVIPNFGSKSVAASWMAMFGSFVIFAYSIFVELKEESFKSSFNTYSCYTEKIEIYNFIIPFYRTGDCGILRYQENNSIKYLNSELTINDTPSVGVELILINAISYISSDLRDWKSEKYSSPGTFRETYRKMKDAAGDTVLIEGTELLRPTLKYFDISPEAPHEFGGYSIVPRGSRLSIHKKKLTLSNSHFSFEIEPFDLGRIYRIDSDDPETIWITDFDVRVSFRLFKSRSGHWRRSEYKDFCNALAEGIKARLEVPNERWPKSRSWV
ncbi:hypothetical protein [Pseudomonas sp. PSE14]|uniref:hypothetical protein n=1 Tax=Pseudomonas sp. PSE14 TaxID=3016341 RepID=UPI0023D8B5FB|nr:hypothetical protein [Pseudomonas sp. PSE14]WEJ73449.1 hypothetical protein O6P39_06055 [Pseudomonas sp. PSE14]